MLTCFLQQHLNAGQRSIERTHCANSYAGSARCGKGHEAQLVDDERLDSRHLLQNAQ